MLMPLTRNGSRTNLKTTKHTATKTRMRTSVTRGLRPTAMTRSQPGRGGLASVGADMWKTFNAFPKFRNIDLRHRLVERGVKLVHRRLGFVAHVGQTERGAFDFSVAAVNQEALILRQLLQFCHVHRAAAGPSPVADAGERYGFKTLFGIQIETVLRRPIARELVGFLVARVTIL